VIERPRLSSELVRELMLNGTLHHVAEHLALDLLDERERHVGLLGDVRHGKDCGCQDCVNWRIALETRRTGVCARCKGAGAFQVGLVNEATTQTIRCPCSGHLDPTAPEEG